MTHEEVKTGLQCCLAPVPKCEVCPLKSYANCTHVLKHGALIHMRELEEQIALMQIQMQGDCGTCTHRERKDEFCEICLRSDKRPYWQYEGLPEVKTR